MAICPDATYRPLTRAVIMMFEDPVRFTVHTAWITAMSLYGWANTNADGIYPHFFIKEDGEIEQYLDTMYRSTSDYKGNPNTISVETWDNKDLSRPLNEAQLASLVRLWKWVREAHPTIPNKLAIDNKVLGDSSHGLAWHRLGVPGFRLYEPPEGQEWSTVNRKECPGDAKINQIPEVFRLGNEDDMSDATILMFINAARDKIIEDLTKVVQDEGVRTRNYIYDQRRALQIQGLDRTGFTPIGLNASEHVVLKLKPFFDKVGLDIAALDVDEMALVQGIREQLHEAFTTLDVNVNLDAEDLSAIEDAVATRFLGGLNRE